MFTNKFANLSTDDLQEQVAWLAHCHDRSVQSATRAGTAFVVVLLMFILTIIVPSLVLDTPDPGLVQSIITALNWVIGVLLFLSAVIFAWIASETMASGRTFARAWEEYESRMI
nr:hypothetical protein [Kocuria sp.]